MQTITTIGLDIAKSVFQVHGVAQARIAATRSSGDGQLDYLADRTVDLQILHNPLHGVSENGINSTQPTA
jgi:hypothetical protein